jgi:hypothetical protein
MIEVNRFIHPIPLLAVAVLILNDHFLKAHFGSWLTGKLSDWMGLFFTPLFLCAVAGLALTVIFKFLERPVPQVSWAVFFALVFFTDVVFIAVKVSPAANRMYTSFIYSLGFPSQIIMDRSDLWALIAGIPTYIFRMRMVQANAPLS